MTGKRVVLPLTLVLAFVGVALIFAGPSGPIDADLFVLRSVSRLRSPALNNAFVFLTELGRTPVALLFSVVAWRQSRPMAIRMATATLGGEIIADLVKLAIHRQRPIEILPLVAASGYSFPSGHAVVAAATYTTAAILVCRTLQRRSNRILVISAAVLTIVLVALSRVYLGVHYASDSIGGILLGTGWAAFLAQHWYDSPRVPTKGSGYDVYDNKARD